MNPEAIDSINTFYKRVGIKASESEPFRIQCAFPIKAQSNEACHSCEMHGNTKQKAPTYILTGVYNREGVWHWPTRILL